MKIDNRNTWGGSADQKSEAYDERRGVYHPTLEINLNPVKPPSFIKIINNDGVDGQGCYSFIIPYTADSGVSDGGWYRDENTPDNMGGFFGRTKFIYGEGENDYFIGTFSANHKISPTFKFE